MHESHPLQHGLKEGIGRHRRNDRFGNYKNMPHEDVGWVGIAGLHATQQLWYEFHIECLLRKLNDMQSSGIPAQRDFLLQEFQRINKLNSPQPSSDPEPPLTMA